MKYINTPKDLNGFTFTFSKVTQATQKEFIHQGKRFIKIICVVCYWKDLNSYINCDNPASELTQTIQLDHTETTGDQTDLLDIALETIAIKNNVVCLDVVDPFIISDPVTIETDYIPEV